MSEPTEDGRSSDADLRPTQLNVGGMTRRFSFVCDDDLADRVQSIARRYGVSEQEALRQVIETGLDEVEERV